MTNLAIPKILVPLAITDDIFQSSTVAEPNTGETEWVSAGTYVASDIRIRAGIHRKFMALVDHTGITIAPEDDPNRWKDIGATDAWAMFDMMRTTQTLDTETLTVVLQPGFFNGIALLLPEGASANATVKSTPGGTVVLNQTQLLDGPYVDEYDWCWGPARRKRSVVYSGILPYPEAELTLTLSAPAGVTVGCGMAAIGDLRPLVLGDWGGTEAGAEARPISKSRVTEDLRGYATIKRLPGGTDLRLTIKLPQEHADYALATLQEVQDIPVVIIGAEAEGCSGLTTFGLISGVVKYDSKDGVAVIEADVKGLI